MKVLHLCHCYPPAIGGSETLMAELSRRLVADHGHDVTVVTTTGLSTAAFRVPGTPTLTPGEEQLDGVRVRRHPVSSRLAPRLRRYQEQAFRFRIPGNGALRTVYDGPLAPGILRDACRQSADLIAATAFPLLHMHFAVAAARARRLPVVLFGALHPEDRWGFDREVIRLAIRAATAYCAYTHYEAEHVLRLGIPESRVHVLPPGVDPSRFVGATGEGVRSRLGIASSSLVIGFFGQIAGHKGIADLVAAFAVVAAQRPEVHLVLAGGRTPDTEAITRSVDELAPDLGRRVHTLLDVSEDAKPETLAAFDIFASPSGYESFGITSLEAWASGLPVVACGVGAVRSVIDDGSDGLLVPYRNPQALAVALARLIDHPDLRRELAAGGHAKMLTRYTWGRSAERAAALYEALATGS